MSDGRHPLILVVEDERHLAAGLKLNFELEGYRVHLAATAREASNLLVGPEPYGVVILDVMLPDMDGFSLCRALRQSGNFTPVIMLTARSDPSDRINGLDVGADDYLAKPFELSELLARVRSLLRRRRWERQESAPRRVVRFGKAVINFETHDVAIDGAAVKLTQLELDLVRYFVENAGRVLSRDELLEKVWKMHRPPNTRTVDNFIVRLRKYFETDATQPEYFLSVRGSGYKFVPPAESP